MSTVFESSQWPVVGIFGGQVDHFGNFDECLLVSGRGVKGQYCLAQAIYDFNITKKTLHYSSEINDHPDEEESAWNAIKMVSTIFFIWSKLLHRINSKIRNSRKQLVVF